MTLSLKPSLRRLLPSTVRRRGRRLVDFGVQCWDRISGSRVVRQPPESLVQGIGGGWSLGERFLHYFRTLGELKPHECVLDAGCGVGRMAAPLTAYLAGGRYEGFDIMAANIDWCRRGISRKWPNFQFRHADIFNREYNPTGRVSCGEYRFPYPDGTFEFAFLTSVFTHLMPPDAAHYFRELGRVLKPGGRCLATIFLLNDESRALVDAGQAHFPLHPFEVLHRVQDRNVPEACIALDEGFIRSAVNAAGLGMDTPVHYGSWCGRDPAFDFQDIAILRKA